MNRELSYNQITSIPNGAFAGLGNLTTLFVSFEFVTRDVCVLDWGVVTRDLNFNRITSISNGAFTGLGNLTQLFVT
jgi:Leucine-rich repeat (LRR) protein